MTDDDTQKTDETPIIEPERTTSLEQEQQPSIDKQPIIEEPVAEDTPDEAVTSTDSVPLEQAEEQVPDQSENPDPAPQPDEPTIVAETLTHAEQFSKIASGMTVRVHQKIKDVNSKGEEKERIQVFEGMVLAHKHGTEAGASITVRKVTNGVGVEKIFPLNLPSIEKIEIVKQAHIRQSRPYFLRNYKKRLKEKRIEHTLTPA